MKKLITIFILCLTNTTWAQDWEFVADLAPPEATESDFGANMVFAGDKLVVSWPRVFTRGNDADSCGEVITYEKVDGEFEEIARLTAEDLTGSCVDGDGFGYGMAFLDGKLAIGMPAGVRSGIGFTGGATDADSRVFITTFESGNWVLEETLIGSDIGNGKGMGFHMVMEDDILLVHAHEYDTIFGYSFPVSTGVYVFKDEGSGYIEQQKLEENFHLFGQDYDYANNQIIVGAWGEQMLTQPGRIYVYENTGSSWEIVQTIDDSRNSNLGSQIDISGNTMVAGNVQAGGIGGATVFTKDNNGQWSESQFIQASDNAFNDQFGIAIVLNGDELAIGAGAGEDPVQTLGAVYTFVKDSNGQFVEKQKLIANNPTDLYDRFGSNLIFNDSDLLVTSISGGFVDADVTTLHHFSRESSGGEPDPQYNVTSKVSGTWVAEGADNQGLSIEVLSDGRVVMYASLNHESENFWMIGVGEANNNTIVFDQVHSTNGAVFGDLFNSDDVNVINEGQAMITFSQCGQSTLSYDFPTLETTEVALTKDMEIQGNECDNSIKALPNGISGSWFDPNRSGEGFTVYLHSETEALVTWYTYDANGNQFWVSGIGSITEQTINVAEMTQYKGAELFNGATTQSVMGSLSMTWDVCRNALVNYDFKTGNMGSGQLNLNQLTVLDDTQCNL